MSYFEFPHTRNYDQDLGWLIDHIANYDDTINALQTWIDTYTPSIKELQEFMKDMFNGPLPDGVKNVLKEWCSENLIDLVGSTITSVYFEVDENGYFIAYIPDSWDDITFYTTEYDLYPTEYEYGHLVLSY